jgi:hypothetical protein
MKFDNVPVSVHDATGVTQLVPWRWTHSHVCWTNGGGGIALIINNIQAAAGLHAPSISIGRRTEARMREHRRERDVLGRLPHLGHLHVAAQEHGVARRMEDELAAELV